MGRDPVLALDMASSIGSAISALVFVLDSTDRRIAQVLKTKYSDKYEMKEVGATAYRYEEQMVELGVLGMAKIMEDMLVMFEKNSLPHRFWKDFESVGHIAHAKMIRMLANVIKHHESILRVEHSSDAASLVKNYGFTSGASIKDWTRGASETGPNPCPYFNLYRVQCFCISAINAQCGVRIPVPNWNNEDIRSRLIAQWIGDFIAIESRMLKEQEGNTH